MSGATAKPGSSAPRSPARSAGRRTHRPRPRGMDVFRGATPTRVVTNAGDRRHVPEYMTVSQFSAFPWPELQRWELIHGVPVMAASPRPMNQNLLAILTAFLVPRFRESLVVAELDYQPPGYRTYVTPDVMVLPLDADYDETKVPYTGTPQLVIEIISPSNAANDWGAKQNVYASAGIPEYWIVDPNTCAIAIHTSPARGAYAPALVDDEGFVLSPALNCRLVLRREGPTFKIDTASERSTKPRRASAKKKRAR